MPGFFLNDFLWGVKIKYYNSLKIIHTVLWAYIINKFHKSSITDKIESAYIKYIKYIIVASWEFWTKFLVLRNRTLNGPSLCPFSVLYFNELSVLFFNKTTINILKYAIRNLRRSFELSVS